MMTTAHTSTVGNSRRVPLDKRKRTETSCDKCKSRKQKCRKEPGQNACRYCIAHKIECLTTQPRKKRLYGSVEGLGNRLALLESLVKGLLPEADVSNAEELRQLGASLGIPLPDSMAGDANEDTVNSGTEGEEALSLLPDQQGQVQYIGPASSFSFHVRLHTLVGKGAVREFVLFGRNAADQGPLEGDQDPHALSTPSTIDHNSSADQRTPANEASSLQSLIATYFDQINPDFPVLHEPTFREAYKSWTVNTRNADPAWLCSFMCVLLLARRVARFNFPEDQENLWWRRVQSVLPVIIFTSSITAVQALLLAALHLHNTNHRDACWNLTGTATRIAFAIGLHQDRASNLHSPVATELRKRLWWTLCAFEVMQVSSYDRPSAIEHLGLRVGSANEHIIGMADYNPPDYCKWFNRLVVHLSSACKAPKNTKANLSEESYVGPLSPAAGVLRDLDRWKESLPSHLRVENINSSSQFQRPLILLHAKYHYTVILLCRAALLARATILSKQGTDSANIVLNSMSDTCVKSGRILAQLMIQLESTGKFDAVYWWDIWYAHAAASILVIDLVCINKKGGDDMLESRILLAQLADLAARHMRNSHMPGTIKKWCSLIPELNATMDSMSTQRQQPQHTQPGQDPGLPQMPQTHLDPSPYPVEQPINNGAYMYAENIPERYYSETEFAGPHPNSRLDRNAQMNFMDFTISNIQDWNWGDIGSLLGNGHVG
ncbi:hypothetical protein CC78DRAFT_530870 [Lojkania enalia]|uniref:Zn(2)-C6 fungal-type domain-containing protein n=1 Tax=Lojkania enalia TaxID=147567 RepID=A0A9P4N903_9PLEO|nr:hypothetical protein CC78DRAFT_530870 [Didymosphaeria enalia]